MRGLGWQLVASHHQTFPSLSLHSQRLPGHHLVLASQSASLRIECFCPRHMEAKDLCELVTFTVIQPDLFEGMIAA